MIVCSCDSINLEINEITYGNIFYDAMFRNQRKCKCRDCGREFIYHHTSIGDE